MSIVSSIRQYWSLIALVLVLLITFVVTRFPQSDMAPAADSNISQNSSAVRLATPVTVISKKINSNPAVSSANAAASLSHAIESSIRPTVAPLPDFAAIADVKSKKKAFFGYITTLANTANTKIVQLRTEIERMNPQRLTNLQVQRLGRLAKSHKIKTKDAPQQIDLLLRKIEQVPTALVLAQAANESAWGTSRFATQGNNLFGQWCFSKGCGLVPSGRPEGQIYEVRTFKDPQQSVDAYIRNLNAHGSYLRLRRIRECLAEHGDIVSARALSAGLMSYSSRGVDYIDDIRSMIRVNRLEPWEQHWWGNDNKHPCSSLVQLERPPKPANDPIDNITTPEKT